MTDLRPRLPRLPSSLSSRSPLVRSVCLQLVGGGANTELWQGVACRCNCIKVRVRVRVSVELTAAWLRDSTRGSIVKQRGVGTQDVKGGLVVPSLRVLEGSLDHCKAFYPQNNVNADLLAPRLVGPPP